MIHRLEPDFYLFTAYFVIKTTHRYDLESMKKRSEKISQQDLSALGYYDLELIKVAGKTAKKLIRTQKYSKEALLSKLQILLAQPDDFSEDAEFGLLAQKIKERASQNLQQKEIAASFELRKETPSYPIYGAEYIEPGALKQMDTAMQLPISLAGALMPDAHQGYGLPIGGVLATEAHRVIPYAVGVDIACRMCMSIFELPADYLDKNQNKFKNLLLKNTCFGAGKGFDKPKSDDLFDKETWRATKVIRDLKKKAIEQIGSSGTGNHFVEWGWVEVYEQDETLTLPTGKYLALLSHSGSRGFGAGIAGYYSKLAMEKTQLPEHAKHLAWLDLESEEGQEYWIGMNLAGEYASANHHHIHQKIAHDLGLSPLRMIENHHNFAWEDQLEDGRPVIVHRKGATPAHEKELGIIPGSMTHPGFIVKGKGEGKAVFSASHGAGRVMSRSKARKTLQEQDMKNVLKTYGITLIGGDLDEAPMVYKDINQVMSFQSDLVEVLAQFTPRIVRMADKEKFRRKKKGQISFEES